jgi:transcriptional regulator GlxA family with amidase domain
VELTEPIIVKAGEAFAAVPEFSAMSTTRNLAILIFDEVGVLDFCGPFEVFSVANAFTDPPAFHVFSVAQKPGPVLTRGGLSVNPHHRLPDCPRPDLLPVAGGRGTRREMHSQFLAGPLPAESGKAVKPLSGMSSPGGSRHSRDGWAAHT